MRIRYHFIASLHITETRSILFFNEIWQKQHKGWAKYTQKQAFFRLGWTLSCVQVSKVSKLTVSLWIRNVCGRYAIYLSAMHTWKQRFINPSTHETFCKKCIFWTVWWFLGWISAELPSIRSKMHLQHNSSPFLPPASRFSALPLGHAQQSKFWPTSLSFSIFGIFFRLSFFSFSLVFAAVIDLLLGLLAVKKLLRKRHRDGQILLWGFHSTFWAFLCISKAPFSRSLWSGHHWKDLFLLQKLSIGDANFGQKWRRQKRKKGQGSSWAVTGGTGVDGLMI